MDRVELARVLGAPDALAEAGPGPHVIEERDPERFKVAFATAVAAGGDVFLTDPGWGKSERVQLHALLEKANARQPAASSRGWLMIPSGGTSGRLKFARHDEETIGAAVRGFAEHFGIGRVNSVGTLPLHHVSGLMAWMRSVLTGGEHRSCDWKTLETGQPPVLPAENAWVISLVPTQLQRLLASGERIEWLRTFRVIFVGGGPVWNEFADAASRAALPVSLSYGMTETAAMVTALRPEEFLAGARSSGSPLPHVKVTIDAAGRITIGGASLFRGYYPEWNPAPEFVTEDLGRLDERGQLHVVGRRDAMIITGGKKVQPAEVEAALRACGEFDDIAVIGIPDAEWGEIVVACYPAGVRAPRIERAVAELAVWQKPKRFVSVATWPRNAQGKLNRAALRELVRAEMKST